MGNLWINDILIAMTEAQQKALISFVTSIQNDKTVKVTPIKKKTAKQLDAEEYQQMREMVDLNERKRQALKKFA